MPLVDEPGTSLLVWTTTPWTLPGNVAVAAHPEVEYVTIRRGLPEGGSERLILARALVEKVFGDEPVAIVDSYKGKKLKGKRYHPLFKFLHPDKPAHYVVLQDYVTVEDGSGLVHIAPAFGAEDMQAAIEYDLPILMTVADDGTFIPEVRPWSGQFVKDADPYIIEDLQRPRSAVSRRHLSPTLTRSAGVVIPHCSTMHAAPGTSAPASSRTGWSS